MTFTELVRPRRTAPAAANRPPDRVSQRSPHARFAVLALAVLILASVVMLSVLVGARPLALQDVWSALMDPSAPQRAVVRQMRVPRTILGLLAGAALGVAGLVMQAVTHGPLADPGLLGITAGASAAAATAAVVREASSVGNTVWFAMGGAAVVAAAVYFVGGGPAATPTRLALAGAALNATLYSYVSAVLGGPFFLALVLPVPILAITRRPLALLEMGASVATGLGVRVALVRLVTLTAAALLASLAAAAAGPVAFVALVAPQLARRLSRTPGPGLLASMTTGAALMVGADLIAQRALDDHQLPVGVVTGLLGGGYLVWLLAARTTERIR